MALQLEKGPALLGTRLRLERLAALFAAIEALSPGDLNHQLALMIGFVVALMLLVAQPHMLLPAAISATTEYSRWLIV